MAPLSGPAWLQRLGALLLAVAGVPALLSVSAFLQDTPIRVGEPSPRTVIAPDLIRVPDLEATERARRAAADAVAPVEVVDTEAKAAIVQDVRDFFARVQAVREPGADGRRPSTEEQVRALDEQTDLVSREALASLVELSDDDLAQVSREAVQIAQQIALQRIAADEVEAVRQGQLQNELTVRSFPGDIEQEVVEPVVAAAIRPTVQIDEAATRRAREDAAAEVADVVKAFPGGTPIVRAGELVSDVQFAALKQRGLEGAEPWRVVVRAFALSMVVTLVVAAYLRAYRQQVWQSARRCLLLALLFVLFSAVLEGVVLGAPSGGWLFIVPAGALAMLATILFDPPVGVLVTIPATALVAFSIPEQPGVAVFAALAGLGSVPLVSRLSAQGDLRRAAWQSTVGYAVLAGLLAMVFEAPILTAVGAGLANGVITAVMVNGSLPFLESLFGIVTATSLLDLADRNHPLLRELEQKALGSYNHSIMVSTMVERAARAIGADALLGSVAALYHDIGKVRRPYFFVENQFGIANPHDELPPEVSAEIIQRHVTDGIELARSCRLPPEVVEGIATHHGTTLVTYFYRKAMNQAADGGVEETMFRYKGRRPSTKEMAILMLADCCESAARAAALNDRDLTDEAIEKIVHSLVADRVEDGQLDEANLTFRELTTIQESFITSLVGVYHPRIAYPELRQRPAVSTTDVDSNGQGPQPQPQPQPQEDRARQPG